MKRLLFSSCLFLVGTCAFAQFQKGNILVGGTVGYSQNGGESKYGSATIKNPVNISYSILPEGGYFITDRFYLGISPGYFGARTTYKYESSFIDKKVETYSAIPITVSGRLFFNSDEKLNFFTGLDLAYAIGKYNNETVYTDGVSKSIKNKTQEEIASINAGISYFLGKRLVVFGRWTALTAVFLQNENAYNQPNSSKSKSYYIDFGASSYINPFNAGIFFVLK